MFWALFCGLHFIFKTEKVHEVYEVKGKGPAPLLFAQEHGGSPLVSFQAFCAFTSLYTHVHRIQVILFLFNAISIIL